MVKNLDEVTRWVEVDQKCIANGRCHQSWNCPVYHGVRKAFPEIVRFDVSVSKLISTENKVVNGKLTYCENIIANLPWEVSENIRRFDAGKALEPFGFSLTIPKKFLQEMETVSEIETQI